MNTLTHEYDKVIHSDENPWQLPMVINLEKDTITHNTSLTDDWKE